VCAKTFSNNNVYALILIICATTLSMQLCATTFKYGPL